MSKNDKPQSRIAGRDSINGQFVPVKETLQRPQTTVRERLPLPGFGDTNQKNDNAKK